ncbi:small subunit rRNA maturation protein UTP4 [Ascoidea rubescens DSM 1968]|uniref:WD40 repeat-like protein n=1 Tax=Ascoidea rubescens DSM 1968 TaxID=1344418 RepID=A0A1D2VAR4_9ASCO|nr:WD40 repeat-like protein [Ascoidea rubescens DSM 1968]ODV58675.1 WD40 repeat-like protein [Ascoidea rubescens DSM 1968]
MDIHRCRFVPYEPHTITSLAFSHKSNNSFTPIDLRLAVGRSNGDIEIWNPRFNWFQELIIRGGKNRSIEGLVWALWEDNIPRLFSIGGSTVITEWNLSNGLPLKNYDCNSGIIWSIDISDDSNHLIVGCDNGSAVLIDISGGPGSLEHDSILQRQNSRILSIAFNKNKQVIGGCADGRIRCWSVNGINKGKLLATMKVDKSKVESTLVWSILVLPAKNYIVSGDSTGSIKFWDLTHFTLRQSFKISESDILTLTKDFTEENVFCAGIDRKIYSFDLVEVARNNQKSQSKNIQWVNSYKRLCHSNDIRSIASFQSKFSNFLVSGGVEKTIIINSIKEFNSTPFKKIPITQQLEQNLIVNSLKKFIIIWQDQTIKIWKIFSPDNYKLISKLSLSEDQNISSCSITNDGKYLAVSTLSYIRVFKLTEFKTIDNKPRLKIKKLRVLSEQLNEYSGKLIKFLNNDNNTLIVLTTDNEIYKISFNIENFENEENIDNIDDLIINPVELEISENKKLKSKYEYLLNIKNLKISKDNKYIAVSRFSGEINIISLESNESFQLTKLSVPPCDIEFTNRNTLIVIAIDHKIYEFNYLSIILSKTIIEIDNNDNNDDDDGKSNNLSLLSEWSKNNSEYLPTSFVLLENKCCGIFTNSISKDRIWFWGPDWIVFYDLSFNIRDGLVKNEKGVEKRFKGLSVLENEELLENGDKDNKNDNLENDEDIDEDMNLLELLNEKSNRKVSNSSSKAYWFSDRYNFILFADSFGEKEIAVIERDENILRKTPAFKSRNINV